MPNDDTVAAEARAKTTVAPHAEVEVTLIDLDSELEQLCEHALEPLNGDQVDDTGDAKPDAALGVRLAYRVSYDPDADALEHVVFFPARSNPAVNQFARVPTAVRRALPVVVVSAQRPLQQRAEGALRRLIVESDADGAADAFRTLEQAVAAVTEAVTGQPAIRTTVDEVFKAGGLGGHLADPTPDADQVRFRAEDGSLSGLLRAMQPFLDLDDAGPLALANHGSTASAVLSAAEAVLLAQSVGGAVILGDDIGDNLDASTAQHVAAVLRISADQVWLTTRRPEVARAFAPTELIRLSRRGGRRNVHRVPEPIDKKEIATRRLLHSQILPALTSGTIAITEGPHDLTTYSTADRHRAAGTMSLPASGVRLISADSGSGGGTGQIPRVARLAREMGFRIIAVIDGDPAKTATDLVDIEAAADVVVRLPTSIAIERALVTDVHATHLRAAASAFPAYGLVDPTIGLSDPGVHDAVVAMLHRKGAHEQFLETLIGETKALPPLIDKILATIAAASSAGYRGPTRIDLTWPTPTSAPDNSEES